MHISCRPNQFPIGKHNIIWVPTTTIEFNFIHIVKRFCCFWIWIFSTIRIYSCIVTFNEGHFSFGYLRDTIMAYQQRFRRRVIKRIQDTICKAKIPSFRDLNFCTLAPRGLIYFFQHYRLIHINGFAQKLDACRIVQIRLVCFIGPTIIIKHTKHGFNVFI